MRKKVMNEIKDAILKESRNENVVISTEEGLAVYKLADFVSQPVDGILYDLNRLEEVVLTFLPDPKWVNDYAVAAVIRRLKSETVRMETRIAEMEKSVTDFLNAFDAEEDVPYEELTRMRYVFTPTPDRP